MFDKSGVSVAAAWHGIMDFAIHHHLPYSAIQNLLKLLSFISPESNHLPKTLHLLKKQYKLEVPEKKKYCSHCLQIVQANEAKCSKLVCKKNCADICWYVHVPIAEQIKVLFEGKII